VGSFVWIRTVFCVDKDRVLQKFRSVLLLFESFVYGKHRPKPESLWLTGVLPDGL
jgi:hypothetical protein